MKEDKYREALQDRTIEPSSGSWDKLSSQLDAQEAQSKNRNWSFLKVAVGILLVISIGFYFNRPEKEIIEEPVLVAPQVIEIQKTSPDVDDLNSTETASKPKTVEIEPAPFIDSAQQESIAVKVNFKQPIIQNEDSPIEVERVTALDSVTEAILLTESFDSEEQFIDDEIEELLNKSRIKLVINGEISSRKVVDANALLDAVEEDIYKDLKQKLIEKISNTLKNPKEVVTSRDD